MRYKRSHNNDEIREAIDSYPGGLCFAEISGKTILVNRQMNKLIDAMTGHTLIEVNQTWDDLSNMPLLNGCSRLDRPWMKQAHFCDDENSLLFLFPDDTVWQFRRTLLDDQGEQILQIEAADITQIYRMSEELYLNNQRLVELRKRQEALLANIVKINQDKELLSAKMHIHDDFGRCLVATKKAIMDGDLTESTYQMLLSGWGEAIRDMQNLQQQSAMPSPEAELRKVANLVGCRLYFSGEQPKERRSLLLMYSVIREALTNAVRHAGATALTVEISQQQNLYHVVIGNNGKSEIRTIHESGGLRNLRHALEQQGAQLNYAFGSSVTVIADIPVLH